MQKYEHMIQNKLRKENDKFYKVSMLSHQIKNLHCMKSESINYRKI